MDYKTKTHYRAFAITANPNRGRWVYWAVWDQLEVDRAINRALDECQVAREEHGVENECQIYAVGDIVVFEMSAREREAATAYYAKNPFEGTTAMESETQEPLIPDISGKFDGEWVGRMACSTCPHCVGAIDKSVSLSIEKGMFLFAPDLAYTGVGRVDEYGNVRIRWEQGETYAEMTRPKNIRFNGQIVDGQLELHGERGPRECTVTLLRAIASES